jgi:outer membrane beta-barrel protein
MMKRFAILLSALPATMAVLPRAARAELPERVSPLADAPAVRHRAELREKRFEIGPSVTTTVGQDFYHAVMVGGRLSIHLTDWIAVSAMGAVNVTPNFTTSFNNTLTGGEPGGLPEAEGTDRTPPRKEALLGQNKIAQTFGGQLELSPISGKYALFSSIFANYDIYAFGGLGVINFTADSVDANHCTEMGRHHYVNSCPVTGMKLGPTFGAGMHTFLGDFVALDLEFRDTMVRNNAAGRDANGDLLVDSDDQSLGHTFMVGLALTLFLPTDAHISD